MPAPVKTARLKINQWLTGDVPFTRAQRNDDAAALEAAVALYGQGTLGDRPAATADREGTFYTITDATGGGVIGTVYYCTGAGWVTAPIPPAPDLSGKLDVGAKAADSNLLDGIDSTGFLLVGGKAADSELLDGIDSTGFARSARPNQAIGYAELFLHGR